REGGLRRQVGRDRRLAHTPLGTGHQHSLHPLPPPWERAASVHRPRDGGETRDARGVRSLRDLYAASRKRGNDGGRHGRSAPAIVAGRLPIPTRSSSMSDLQDLVALIRADTPLIVVETPDEMRVVELFRQSLTRIWRALYRWSITEGLRRLDLDREDPAQAPPDAGTTLAAIRDADQRGVYLLLDFHPYLGYAATQRQLREILQRRGCLPHTIVLVGHRVELPGELEARAARLRLRLPDGNALLRIVREEIAAFQRENQGARVVADDAVVRRIVRNLQGLDAMDARRIVRHLVHDDGVLGPGDLPELTRLKFELLNKSGHLHYEYDTARFADVAGARRLKRWIDLRRRVFTGDGEPPPGLDPPRGILLLGVQGCGKSLLAKAVAGGFGVPLVRLDFGTLYAKYHGETEANLRQALESTERLAPCVLWIDEIEKGLAASGADGDGGVSRRVLGYLLTWMAERKAPVFLVA